MQLDGRRGPNRQHLIRSRPPSWSAFGVIGGMFLLVTPIFAPLARGQGQELRVVARIAGLRSDAGAVGCALFADASAFPTHPERAVAQTFVRPHAGQAACDFVPPNVGTYAVVAYHDENDNRRLDRNFIGIPLEGVGCSNGARGHFGPPHFSDASFVFNGGTVTVLIQIRY